MSASEPARAPLTLCSSAGPNGPTTVTRWVDTDSAWWVYPQVETRIKIESDRVLGGARKELHEVAVTHDSGTSVSVETKPVREWERTTATALSTSTTRRTLTWK